MLREPEFRERLTKRGLDPAALDADIIAIDDYIACAAAMNRTAPPIT